jgi:hypothetical protein
MNTQPRLHRHDRHSQPRLALTPDAGDLRIPPRRRSAQGTAVLLWTALMRRSLWRVWRALHTRASQATVWC